MTDQIIHNVTEAHITQTPGVCGGKPCIAGRRIRVQDVSVWHEFLGMSAEEIASEYSLTLAQVYAALAYYYQQKAEIDAVLRSEAQQAENYLQKLDEQGKLIRRD